MPPYVAAPIVQHHIILSTSFHRFIRDVKMPSICVSVGEGERKILGGGVQMYACVSLPVVCVCVVVGGRWEGTPRVGVSKHVDLSSKGRLDRREQSRVTLQGLRPTPSQAMNPPRILGDKSLDQGSRVSCSTKRHMPDIVPEGLGAPQGRAVEVENRSCTDHNSHLIRASVGQMMADNRPVTWMSVGIPYLLSPGSSPPSLINIPRPPLSRCGDWGRVAFPFRRPYP